MTRWLTAPSSYLPPRRLAGSTCCGRSGSCPTGSTPPISMKHPRSSELPPAHAMRLAEEKARAVMPRHPGAFILAADTVVACGRRILPKAFGSGDCAVLPRTTVGTPPSRPWWHRFGEPGRSADIAPRRQPGRIQAPQRGRDHGLSLLRRMARQGRRLRDPGPGSRR